MALIALVLFFVGVHLVTQQQLRERPDPEKTPGVAAGLSAEEVCSGRPVPVVAESVRKSVFDRYGIDRPKPEDYELDFLIPPSLGGASDRKNLWPQPTGRIEWSAHIKNALEEQLRELVCKRSISLEEAQAALTGDWVAAYQKYFHARLPLQIHVHP